MSYKVKENHSLDEYNKKYGNQNLQEVLKEDADKDPSLLENKKWWLINGTYYEVKDSKCAILAWWSSLAKAAKIGIIAGATVAVAAAVVLPIVLNSNKENEDYVTINLEYHDCIDSWFDYDFSKTRTTIKSNETEWTISIRIGNNRCNDWNIVFCDDFDNPTTKYAESTQHAGKSVPGTYQETVVLSNGVNLKDYADATFHVCLYCLSA